MEYVLGSATAVTERFPLCTAETWDTVRVAVHASVNEGKLGVGSASRVVQGMSLWFATLIHGVGVELYVSARALFCVHWLFSH